MAIKPRPIDHLAARDGPPQGDAPPDTGRDHRCPPCQFQLPAPRRAASTETAIAGPAITLIRLRTSSHSAGSTRLYDCDGHRSRYVEVGGQFRAYERPGMRPGPVVQAPSGSGARAESAASRREP